MNECSKGGRRFTGEQRWRTETHLPGEAPPRDARAAEAVRRHGGRTEQTTAERGVLELRDLGARVEEKVVRVPGRQGVIGYRDASPTRGASLNRKTDLISAMLGLVRGSPIGGAGVKERVWGGAGRAVEGDQSKSMPTVAEQPWAGYSTPTSCRRPALPRASPGYVSCQLTDELQVTRIYMREAPSKSRSSFRQ